MQEKDKKIEITKENLQKRCNEIQKLKVSAYLIFKLESSQDNNDCVDLSLTIQKDFTSGYQIPQSKEDEEEVEEKEEVEIADIKNDYENSYWDRDYYQEETNFNSFYSVQQTCLVEFLTFFFGFSNIKQISFDCSTSQMARFVLVTVKSCEKPIHTINCVQFFTKNEGFYNILDENFFFETLEDWKGIELQIHSYQGKLQTETFEQTLGTLKQLSELREVEFKVVSLNEASKDINELIQYLESYQKNLQKLTFEVTLDSLLPVIRFHNLQNQVQVQIIYTYQLLKLVSSIELLNYIASFSTNKQNLFIPGCVKITRRLFKIDWYNKILSENNDPKKDELKPFLKTLSAGIQQHQKLIMILSPHQKLDLKKFVVFLKLLCKKTSLACVELMIDHISKQMSALSLCKFIQSGKVNARINMQTFKFGKLDLKLDQISDVGMIALLEKCCFTQDSSTITHISINSNIVIGHLQPFSCYLKNETDFLESFLLQIENPHCDLSYILLQIVKDRQALESLTKQFFFIQRGEDFKEKELSLTEILRNKKFHGLCFNFSQGWGSIQLGQKYSINESLEIMGADLDNEFKEYLIKTFNPITNFNDYQTPYDKIISKFELFAFWRQVYERYLQNKFLSFQIQVFFSILAPVLPLNPSMVIRDLYEIA